ncbi:hypothetical protein SN1_085 [Sphaerotilus phage SN1]|uniref:Uncharacterized protein n=1 Tax=Pseudomonas phage vB_PaeS_FBPa53 TaxID=3231242 RepID=A0AAU8KTQ9_9VIRU|nr:hypothetical protein SN1_085 [Sphaerotilus phage SN1]
MNQDPNKRPNGTYKPKAERVPPVNLDAAIHGGLRLLAFALFRQAMVEAIVEQREKALGIPTGDGSAATSWEELERVLGKETVDKMRAGT